MKRSSLVFRLALLQSAVIGLVLLVFSISAILLSIRTLERQEQRLLEHSAADLRAVLEREWNEEGSLGAAAAAVMQEDAVTNVDFDILDASGASVLPGPATSRLHRAQDRHSWRLRVPRGAWVVVSVSTRPRQQAIGVLVGVLLLVGIPLFVLTLLLSRTFALRMLRPLRRMAEESRLATERGVTRPLGEAGDPSELHDLAAAFNGLLARFERMLDSERRFAQDAAHELRTPLTVVSGEIEFALAELEVTDPRRPGLERAAVQVSRMTDLVEALLLLRQSTHSSESERLGFVPVDLTELATHAVAELLRREPPRERDVFLTATGEVLVAGNATLLASGIRNLVENAAKFSTPGQAVSVTVRTAGPNAILTVEDGGRGVPERDRERVFDAFYRDAEARASHAGFGLGLAILRRVMRAHGGEIELGRSELGGARFDLRLPLWAPGAD